MAEIYRVDLVVWRVTDDGTDDERNDIEEQICLIKLDTFAEAQSFAEAVAHDVAAIEKEADNE